MEANRTSEDKNKRSNLFEASTMKELKKLAGRTNVTVSDIVREELKDVLEPQVNRIAKMFMKIGKFLPVQCIQRLT